MGAVDLVIQIEAPPSVASGMQRIGRAGHHVGAASEGIIFPKYRADLVACAAVTRAMHEGHVESTRFPRNPLDVLAQQMVAIVAQPPALSSSAPRRRAKPPRRTRESPSKTLFALVRGAAPFAALTRTAFEGVLDLLAGRYPSDEFAELRPRLTWDRVRNVAHAARGREAPRHPQRRHHPRPRPLRRLPRRSAKASPSASASSTKRWSSRASTGETFILGASTWRIDEITHDRVLVSPAPGEPGKMPFWHGDTPAARSSSAAASARWFARLRETAAQRRASAASSASTISTPAPPKI